MAKLPSGDIEDLEPARLRQLGVYGGAQGVWVDKTHTSAAVGEPDGADNVVEKVRLALQSGILHGPVDRWRRGNLYPGEHSSIDRLHVLLPFSIAFPSSPEIADPVRANTAISACCAGN